jgi:hypothetical protein
MVWEIHFVASDRHENVAEPNIFNGIPTHPLLIIGIGSPTTIQII